uniref:BTB domain-containing protein n=1 Tax=Steinernema glaseri TaxID=37863 RepID=A0A1I8AQN6_9BILA
MTNVGKITGTLAKFGTSAEVKIGGAKWSLVLGTASLFSVRCAVGDGTNVLWDCTAKIRLTTWCRADEVKSAVWAKSFDSFNTKDGYAHSQCFQLWFPRWPVNVEAEIEVIKLHVVDLSEPPNKSIGVEDGACFEVDGHELWLSKQVLSVHSPFFEALFSHDFEENATGCYALKEVKIDDFKLFLSVLYNLDIPITMQESLEGLLRLGDIWQCDLVLRFCRDIISRPDSTFLSLRTKIQLCDRHRFSPLLGTIVEKAELNELKALVKDGCCAKLSCFVHSVIMNRLAAS